MGCFVVLGLIGFTAAAPAPAEASYSVSTAKPGDAVAVHASAGRVVFDVTSPGGIGSAAIERRDAGWPKEVVLRLRLTGLEQLEISSGKQSLVIAVDGHDGRPRVRASKREDKNESELDTKSPLWPTVRVVGADGKPAGSLPLKAGGYFEVTVPATLLADGPKSLAVKWVDFFRG